jgi:hypothetical protein
MPETGQNITHWRGNSLTLAIRVLDQNGMPIDVSAADA